MIFRSNIIIKILSICLIVGWFFAPQVLADVPPPMDYRKIEHEIQFEGLEQFPEYRFLLWEGIPSYQQDVIDVPPERKIKLASGGQIGKFYHLFAIKNKEINSQSELKKLLQEKGVLRSRRFLIKFELPVSERVSRLLTIFRLHGIVKVRGIDELSIERIDEKRYYVWQIYLVLILTSFCALLCLGLIAKRRRRLINEKKEL